MAKKHFHLTRTVEKHVLDRVIYIAAFMGPMMAVPQIYQIYSTQSAAGISIWSWIMGLFFGCIWMAHGIFYKLKPVIVAQVLWMTVDLILITGILMFNRDVRIELPYEQLLILNNVGKYATIIGVLAGIAAIWLYLLQQKSIRRA